MLQRIVKAFRKPTAFMALLFLSLSATAQTAGNIVGKWKSEDENKLLQMEIYLANNNSYYGKVINDNSANSKNGTLVLKSLQYNAANQSYKGAMQAPKAGTTVNVTVTMVGADRIKIVAKKFVMSKTIYLSRIK